MSHTSLGFNKISLNNLSVFDRIREGIFCVDNSGACVYINETGANFLRYNATEIIGKNINHFISGNREYNTPHENSWIFKSITTGICQESLKGFLRKADSEVVEVVFNTSYILLDEHVPGALIVFGGNGIEQLLDQTVNQRENALQQQLTQLETSNTELAQFAFLASHDLQEPLRMVTSFLTLLEEKYTDIIDEKGKQYIHYAVDGARRMKQTIIGLLEYAQPGKTNAEIKEEDLNDLLQEIKLLYDGRLSNAGGTLEVAQLPVVVTNRTLLRQVFQNIIDNGIKYQKNDIAPVIKVYCRDNLDCWIFAIEDNGIGIAEQYYNEIFVLLKRLHNNKEYRGFGMGLAIAKRIVESLGGRIWVESEPGNGSTFYFTLLKN